MPHFDDLGYALRTARLRQGMAQYEVAEKAAVTKAMLSGYENGKQLPALQTLDRLLDALGIHLGTLYSLMKFERRRRERAGYEHGKAETQTSHHVTGGEGQVPHDYFSSEVEAAAEETLAAFTSFLDALVERTEERLDAFVEGRESGQSPDSAGELPDERRQETIGGEQC